MTDKTICFINILINGNHHISMDEKIIKKKLYCYERLVKLDYELGYMKNNKYHLIRKNEINIKPRCASFENKEKSIDPEEALLKLLKDLKNINIIIGNNMKLVLNTILAEAVRYNIVFDFTKFIIYDLELELEKIDSIKDSFFEIYNFI